MRDQCEPGIGGQTLAINQSGIPAVGLSHFKTDFDGDAGTDIGFYRSGLWGFLKSGQSFSLGSAQFFSWGGSGLQPIVGDFDGDGREVPEGLLDAMCTVLMAIVAPSHRTAAAN